MPKRFSSNHVLKVLQKNGFVRVSQKGSHIKLRKQNKSVIVPEGRKEIPAGTFHSILRQSGISVDDFTR